jgi:hypothetical protein
MDNSFLKELEEKGPLIEKEMWLELARLNNPLLEKKITKEGLGFLKPIYNAKNTFSEGAISPLALLCEKDIPNKNEILTRWLAESLHQEGFTKNKAVIQFRDNQQEKMLMSFIETNNQEMIGKLIYWSGEMPPPQITLNTEDVRKYIFKNLSIKGLYNISSNWSDSVWTTKWSFEKSAWDYNENDFEANPESFWPIERQSLNFEWVDALLKCGCPTNMLMQGFFNEKEIETIMLRLLKVTFYFHHHELIKDTAKAKSLSNLWIKEEAYPMKVLGLFVEYGGTLQGSWDGVAWWQRWDYFRKSIASWEQWDNYILDYVDSFSREALLLLKANERFVVNPKEKKERL